jgi:hypothetical protein
MIKRTDKVDSRLRGNDGEKRHWMIKRILITAIAAVALLFGTTMYAQKPEKKRRQRRSSPRNRKTCM